MRKTRNEARSYDGKRLSMNCDHRTEKTSSLRKTTRSSSKKEDLTRSQKRESNFKNRRKL